MRRALLACLLIVPFTSACDDASGSRMSDIEGLDGDATNGGDLFASNCSADGCHGADAMGGTGSAPSIAGRSADVVIEAALSGPGAMPSFSSSSDQDIADIAAYVSGL